MPSHGLHRAWNGWNTATLGTSSTSPTPAWENCVSIMAPATGLYFWKYHSVLILLCGGRKDTQKRDIERARNMAKELRNDRRQSRP